MKLAMKLLRIAGLCLAGMAMMSMAAAGTASALPHWSVCTSEATGTKYTTSQCTTASPTGTWAWAELSTTEASVGRASLTLKDTVLGVTVEVGCTGKIEGTHGPGRFDRTTAITEIVCTAGKNCEVLEATPEPRHLPWQTELFETEKTIRDRITAVNGEGAGWKSKCKVPLKGPTEDVCTSETGSTLQENKATGAELLVLGNFDAKSGKAKCTASGGSESGEVRGSVALLLVSGKAEQVSS